MLAIDNISFSYSNANQALSNVSLHVSAGDFVCIAGTNGSGKSTLARHLNALLTPTQGHVRVCGLDTADKTVTMTIRSKVAMVFQNPEDALVASLVEDEVAFGPANLGIPMPKLRQRVTESLDLVGLSGFERHAVHSLSGGQKQRLALAAALATSPEVLILDEATAMLDPAGRQAVLELATALNQAGMTIVMITHHLEDALLANRLVLMSQGSIIAQAAPKQLLANKQLIQDAGLIQPPVAQLANTLQQLGVCVPATADAKELEEALCSLHSTR